MSCGDIAYYSVLEIPKNATEAVVRRAYRRLALKWHPDKNPDNKEEADRRFKEISEAYEILSDVEKRKIYDAEGKAGLARRFNRSTTASGRNSRTDVDPGDPFKKMPHFHFAFRDPADVFREFFGAWNPFEDLFRHHVHLHHHHHHHNLHHRTPYDKEHLNSRRRQFVFTAPQTTSTTHRIHQPGHTITVQKATSQPLRPTVSATTVTGNPGLLLSNMINNSLLTRTPFHPFQRPQVTQIPTLRPTTPVVQGRFSSTSTRFRDGHQYVTRTVIENGRETVTIEQDGIVISMTVNGNSIPIANR